MNRLHKLWALAAAVVMGGTMLTGCGRNEINMTEEELPYGSTMREARTTYAIPVSYDRRFLNDKQLTAITDYFSAVQNCDGELYLANTLDFYADYQINEVYAGQYETFDDMMTALHASVAEATAEDFEYAQITIEDFTQERVSSGLGTMQEFLADIGGAEFTENLTNCWSVNMQWLIRYNNGASSVVINDQYVYLFEVDGNYYCVM